VFDSKCRVRIDVPFVGSTKCHYSEAQCHWRKNYVHTHLFEMGHRLHDQTTSRRRVFALSGGGNSTTAPDIDVDEVLEQRGCKTAFDAVQECMAETNRDWAKCQALVQEWKACFAASELEKNTKK
jgi:hypothetical protein